jgi:hypothetical protein
LLTTADGPVLTGALIVWVDADGVLSGVFCVCARTAIIA